MSEKIDDGGPAFPMQGQPEDRYEGYLGMTLRDWFAGQALAGIAQAVVSAGINSQQTPDDDYCAKWAVGLADATIAELKRITQP